MNKNFAKKAVLLCVAVMAVFSLALLTACGSDQIPNSTTSGLVGSWDWTVHGITTEGYYVFRADGTGDFGLAGAARTDFRWGTRNGVIFMCMTLSICGTSCSAPTEMPYTLEGNTLNVTLLGTTYTYTRGS